MTMYKLRFVLAVSFTVLQCSYSQVEIESQSVNYNFGLVTIQDFIIHNDKFYYSNVDDDLLEYDLKNELVKTVYKGKNNSGGMPMWIPIMDLNVFKGNLYFLSCEPLIDYDLFLYDGIQPPERIYVNSSPGSSARHVAVLNNMLYFNALNEDYELPLFKFDGDTKPEQVDDFHPGVYYQNLENSIEYKGKIYFRNFLSGYGQALLEYDGNSPPTPIYHGDDQRDIVINPDYFNIYNDKLYFGSDDGLCYYDGFKVTRLFWNIEARDLLVCNDKLFFVSDEDGLGSELYAYDEKRDSLYLVRDINEGPNSSNPAYLTVLDSSIYFRASDGISDNALWQYNDAKDTLLLLFDNRINGILFENENSLFFCVWNGAYEEIWQLALGEFSNANAPIQRKYYLEGANSTSRLTSPDENFCVYPNPTTGLLNIECANNRDSYLLTVTDLMGRTVSSSYHERDQKNQILINGPSGIYILFFQNKYGIIKSLRVQKY